MLEWLTTEERRVYPGQHGANYVAMKGQLDVLKWLITLEPEQRRVYPSRYGADWAAENGELEVLEWLAEQGIHPNV